MALLPKAVRNAWRKNAPELEGAFNGALPSFVLARRPGERLDGVPVFCYHLVEPEGFAADLRFLRANGYTTLGTQGMLDHLAGRSEVERAVMLTFDDGARNFHDVAFPLLREHGARAVHFIAPGLHAETADPGEGEDRPMTWPEIRAIHASGCVEFQSHTLESRFVPDWPAPAALAGCAPRLEASRRGAPQPFEADLAASVALLQQQLPGTRVRQLAFPMYQGSDAAIAAAQALGFDACYWGLLPGRPLNRRGDSPFRIARLSDEFVRRLPGEGRCSWGDLLRERVARSRRARAWRQRQLAA